MNTARIDRRVLLVVLAIILVALGVLLAISSGGGPMHNLGATAIEYGLIA